MSVKVIRAFIACDECGREFSVAIEETTHPPPGWSMWDVAKDAVRGSLEYNERDAGHWHISSSVQDEKMLCAACTVTYDRQVIRQRSRLTG